MLRYTLPSLLMMTLLWSLPTQAAEYRLEPLSLIDQQYMQSQRERIDSLARARLAERLRGDRDSDLALLQTLVDRRLIDREDTLTLQALGVVLGDLLRAEHNLNWVIYIDREGRTRALEIPGTRDFLFPVTMISRRYEVGGEVDVRAIYERASGIVAEVRRRQHFY